MKIAFHQITSGSKRDVRETFCAYADAGWRHFEINLWETDAYVAEHGATGLAKLVAESGLTCVGATGLSVTAFQGEEAIRKVEDEMRRRGETMQALGCRAIVVGGDVPKDFRPRAANATEAALVARDAEYRDALARFADVVRRVAAIAEKYGAALALEVNWCGLARSFRTVAELVRMVDRPNVGATWDPAHFYSTPSRLTDLDLLRGKIIHGHLNDFRDCVIECMDGNGDRVIPGTGVLPLKEWTAKIEAIGYSGWHCVELFSDDVWAMPVAEIAKVVKAGCERWWPGAEY